MALTNNSIILRSVNFIPADKLLCDPVTGIQYFTDTTFVGYEEATVVRPTYGFSSYDAVYRFDKAVHYGACPAIRDAENLNRAEKFFEISNNPDTLSGTKIIKTVSGNTSSYHISYFESSLDKDYRAFCYKLHYLTPKEFLCKIYAKKDVKDFISFTSSFKSYGTLRCDIPSINWMNGSTLSDYLKFSFEKAKAHYKEYCDYHINRAPVHEQECSRMSELRSLKQELLAFEAKAREFSSKSTTASCEDSSCKSIW